MGKKKGNVPLISCLKSTGKIERQVILIFSNADPKILKRVTGINMCIKKVNELLLQRINNVNTVCKLNMPYINLHICTKDHFKGGDLKLSDIEDTDHPRVIIRVSPDDQIKITPDDYDEKDISHLIQVVLEGSSVDEDCEFVDHSYSVEENQIADIITDILLDISAYHSWDILECNMGKIEFRRQFSAKKCQYALNEGLKNRYSSLKTTDRYFSFAFSSYDSDGRFNAGLFIDTWEKFMRTVVVKGMEDEIFHKRISLEEQLQYYSRTDNLPIKKVMNMYEELPGGVYLLVRTESEPRNNPRCRKQIITLFGMYKKWKTGTVKFIPMDRYHEAVRWYPYVSLWKIIK